MKPAKGFAGFLVTPLVHRQVSGLQGTARLQDGGGDEVGLEGISQMRTREIEH